MIHALTYRYPSAVPVADPSGWVEGYATEMRQVYLRFPDHPDVCTLYAESLMNRTPWKLWDLKTGEIAEGAATAEAGAVLETALRRIEDAGSPRHPGLLHMYIHLMEMSPHPERAMKVADRLRGLVPDSGHLLHMPTHIDVLCGHYQAVVDSNDAAIVADRKHQDRGEADIFYSGYRCHNYHFKVYGAMFLGQNRTAIEAAEEMISSILTAELLRVRSPNMADWLEGVVSVKQHVLIRFGRWEEIIAQELPEDQELYCVTTAMMRYARAVALASSGDISAAESESTHFYESLSRVPDSRKLFNNTCVDILAIAREMMLGEIEYRRGDFEAAFAICANQSPSTTTFFMTSPGGGCSRSATRWAPCCWSRVRWKRPAGSIVRTWATMTLSAVPVSIPITCGVCTGITNVCVALAVRRRLRSSSNGSSWPALERTCR